MSNATATKLEPVGEALDGPRRSSSLRSRRVALASPEAQLELLEALPLGEAGLSFDKRLADHGLALTAAALEIIQVNLGKLCNMACRHCHVDAGPDRNDAMMSTATVDEVIELIGASTAHTVDLTGGAPELHPEFRRLVDAAVDRGKHVIDRCNLTILLTRRCADLPEWLGERGVEIVASLPHHRQMNTDAQRGAGTYERSVAALARLNAAGYGQGDPKRVLTLMSNPAGAFLGGCQASMEREWRQLLQDEYSVSFDRLLVLNNMPIARFLEWLAEKGSVAAYMQKLLDAFNPAAVSGLMCKNTLSISWDGRLYDCDFNQMLELEAEQQDGRPYRLDRTTSDAFPARKIVTARHCFGCTAGAGSSCGGATS